MQTMRNLPRNMVWMICCFEDGMKYGISYPETENTECTNLIQSIEFVLFFV